MAELGSWDARRVLDELRATLEALDPHSRPRSAFVVGGPVRDSLLGGDLDAAHDLDVVFEGPALPVGRALVVRCGGTLVEHERFGTATWSTGSGGPSLDLVTARREEYPSSGALPVVTFADLDADLRRRDFTVNAMAIRLWPDPDGALWDPLGGAADLHARVLRIHHARSFEDDPTRLLRAARYAARLGLEPDAPTADAIQAARRGRLWKRVSGDRRAHEWVRLCAELRPLPVLDRLDRWGLLDAFGLDTPAVGRARERWARSTPVEPMAVPEPWWWLARVAGAETWAQAAESLAVPPAEAAAIGERLRVAPERARNLAERGSSGAFDAVARLATPFERNLWRLERPELGPRLDAWLAEPFVPCLRGEDVVRAGVAPKDRGRCLAAARAAQRDGAFSDPEGARRWLVTWMQDGGA